MISRSFVIVCFLRMIFGTLLLLLITYKILSEMNESDFADVVDDLTELEGPEIEFLAEILLKDVIKIRSLSEFISLISPKPT